MLELKIARVQQTLRRLQEDVPLLEKRVAELSHERQVLAKRFAASVIERAEAELNRLLEQRRVEEPDTELPCEPAD
jgi:hypothetical protein